MRLTWTFAQLAGFLGTWSPRKRYREVHGHDALELALPRLERAWGGADAGERPVVWPLADARVPPVRRARGLAKISLSLTGRQRRGEPCRRFRRAITR